jgi:hypothetical protein
LSIKIVTEDYGTYIESQRTSTNTVKVFHDVRYDNGYEYNNNGDRQLTQRHISLSNPAVGQVSNYVYHLADRHISFTPLEYSEVKLNVRIVDQIDANSYVVKEEINMLAGYFLPNRILLPVFGDLKMTCYRLYLMKMNTLDLLLGTYQSFILTLKVKLDIVFHLSDLLTMALI